MKKNLAKILVLVLLVSLFVPSWASAAVYNVSLTLSGGGTSAQPATANQQTDTTLLSALYNTLGDLKAKAQAAYDGEALNDAMNDLLAAYAAGGATWEAKVDAVTITSGNEVDVKNVLKTPSTSTIADLITAAGGTTVTATFVIDTVTYTLTFTVTNYVAPAPVVTEPEASEEPADEDVTVEVNEDGSIDATVSDEAVEEAIESGEPIEIPVEDLEVAEDAEEAVEIAIAIPEGAEDVKILIPIEEVTDTTVIVLVHEDGTEEILPKTALTEDGLVVEIDGDVTIKIVDNAVEFDDIADLTEEEQSAVDFVAARELFVGVEDGVFAPELTMDRYMFATVLYRLESEPETDADINVDDVAEGKWFSDGVAWAAENGIVVGYSDIEFGGTDPVTREQIALMLWRYCGKPAVTAVTETSAHDWAAEAMSWAVQNGLFDATVDAQGEASRLDVAVVLKNFINMQKGADMVMEVEPETEIEVEVEA